MNNEIQHKKVMEIVAEMKELGIWSSKPPDWVDEFEPLLPASEGRFSEWLQFVYLPNRSQSGFQTGKSYEKLIVPQVIRYLGKDIRKGRLLQLLIELDSL